ncbi:MAG: GxxExxY protein [Terriglobales bacterium]
MGDSEGVTGGRLKHREITEKIIRVYYDVYNELGHGFLESVYEEALAIALSQAGCVGERQVAVPVFFRGHKVGQFFADMLVDRVVLVELKAVSALERAHFAQLVHYLKATEIEVGILLNFGPQPAFKRILLNNNRKKIRVNPCESVVGV